MNQSKEMVRLAVEALDEKKGEDIKIIDVYSDSLKHDKPIFSLGENCYHIVKGNKIPFKFKDIYG